MYEFKKTDSKELEKIITIFIASILLLMLVVFYLQFFDVIVTDRVSLATVVLVFGALILLMFDVMYLLQKENRYITLFDIIILLNIASIILSTVLAQNVTLALSGFDRTEESTFVLLSYFVIGFNASLIKEKKNKKIIYVAVTIFAIAQVITGLCQTLIVIPYLEEFFSDMYSGRAFGTLKNANPYGSFMAMAMCFELGYSFTNMNKKNRIVHIVLTVIYFCCLLLSGTRGALLGVIVAVCVVGMVRYNNYKKNVTAKVNKVRAIKIIIGIVALCGAFYITNRPYVNGMVDRTIADIKNGGIGEDRLEVWQKSIEKTWETNPVVGLGISNLYLSWLRKVENADGTYGSELLMVDDAHSHYVGVFANQGIIGLIVYMLMIISIIIYGYRAISGTVINEKMGLYAAYIAYIFAALFCIGMYSLEPYFFLIVGMLAARNDQKRISLFKGKKIVERTEEM